MATKKNEGGANIRFDDFIKLVRPDPGKTEPISLLNGYVGESSSEDKIRLYADSSLAEYVDIAKADILHSIPNNDDPLGGSQLWVKQSASISHNAGTDFAQGDMYNDYMGNMYSPGDAASMGAGAISAVCTIGPTLLTRNIICRPTRFVCPTPVSRLIICTLPQQTRLCPVLTRACPQPSLVDACPSALGCTIGRTVINPGLGTQAFGADDTSYTANYSGGDMYNDYMQNAYEPESFGPPSPWPTTTINTSPVICLMQPTRTTICQRSIFIICRPPQTCFLGTRFPTRITLAGCRTDFCATDFTIPTPTIITTRAATDFTRVTRPFDEDTSTSFGGDYGSGDLYNSYMQNDYSGDMGSMAGNPLDTSAIATAACTIQVTGAACTIQQTFVVQCRPTLPLNTRCCITQQWNTRCCITLPWNTRCCVTQIWNTRCCITRPPGCYQTITNPGVCVPRTQVCSIGQ
jgi:hypothetical protein